MHRDAGEERHAAMFTLTYRAGAVPREKDVSQFIDCVRVWAKRKLLLKTIRYVWVAEMQPGRASRGDAGALHYHVLVWLPESLKRQGNALAARGLKSSAVLPKADKKGWWKHGCTERDWAKKDPVAYVCKYTSKGSEHPLPKGFRLHAAGGFNAAQRLQRSYTALPAWVREHVTPEDRCTRSQGGGFVARSTGEHFSSPWFVVWRGALIRLIRLPPCEAIIQREKFLQRRREATESFSRLQALLSASAFA